MIKKIINYIKTIKLTLKDFIDFTIIPLKHNVPISIQRNKYCSFIKEYIWLISFFGLIGLSLIIFIIWQNCLINNNVWQQPVISNEILISMIFSVISIFGVILGLFENRRQASKQVNIQAKKKSTMHLLKILQELSKDVDFTVQEYECVLYHFGLPDEFIILPECQNFLKNNPTLCKLLKEFVENAMYFDLDKEVKEYINNAHSNLIDFTDGKLPDGWDQFSLISQFQSDITFYFDKKIYDLNY